MLCCKEGFLMVPNDVDCASWPPEFKLMLAVIEDAIVTFQGGLISSSPAQRRRRCEVEDWIRSRDADWPFSFENICSTLRLDPDCIRDGLEQMKRRIHAERRKGRRVRLRRQPAVGAPVSGDAAG